MSKESAYLYRYRLGILVSLIALGEKVIGYQRIAWTPGSTRETRPKVTN